MSLAYEPPIANYNPAQDPDVSKDRRGIIMVFRIPADTMVSNPSRIRSFDTTEPVTRGKVASLEGLFEMFVQYISAVGAKKDELGRPMVTTWWEFVPAATEVEERPTFYAAREYRLWIFVASSAPDFSPLARFDHIMQFTSTTVREKRLAMGKMDSLRRAGHEASATTPFEIDPIERISSPDDMRKAIQMAFSTSTPSDAGTPNPASVFHPLMMIGKTGAGVPPRMSDPNAYIRKSYGSLHYTCPYPQYCFKVPPSTLFADIIEWSVFPWKDRSDTYIRASAELYCNMKNAPVTDSPFSYLPRASTIEMDDDNCRKLREELIRLSQIHDTQQYGKVEHGYSHHAETADAPTTTVDTPPSIEVGDSVFERASASYDQYAAHMGDEGEDTGAAHGAGDSSGDADAQGGGVAVNAAAQQYMDLLHGKTLDIPMMYPKAMKMGDLLGITASNDSSSENSTLYHPRDPFYLLSKLNAVESRRLRTEWESRVKDDPCVLSDNAFFNARALMQHELMGHFEGAWHPAAGHPSPHVKAVIHQTHVYVKERKSLSDIPDGRSVAINLTDTGDMIRRLYIGFEAEFYAVGNHFWLWLAYMCALSTFDDDRKGMPHIVFVGPAMAGKSFVTLVVAMIMKIIAMTVDRRTKASDTAGDCTDGGLTIMDEMQGSYVGASDKKYGESAQTDAEAQFKAKAENGYIETHEPLRDGGTRTIVKTRHYCAEVMLVNTNTLAGMSKAVISRMYIAHMYCLPRSNRNHGDIVQKPDFRFDDQTKKQVEIMRRQMCIMATVNFMIRAGVISDVTMTAFTIKLQQVRKSLRKRVLPMPDIRAVRRMHRIARKLTMMRAADLVLNNIFFHDKDSDAYKTMRGERKFEIRDLLDIEPYLYCTEEIANIVFASMMQQNTGIADMTVLRAVQTQVPTSMVSYEKNVNGAFKAICASLKRRIGGAERRGGISFPGDAPGPVYADGDEAVAEEIRQTEEWAEIQRDLQAKGLVFKDGVWVRDDNGEDGIMRSRVEDLGFVYIHQRAKVAQRQGDAGALVPIIAHPSYIMLEGMWEDPERMRKKLYEFASFGAKKWKLRGEAHLMGDAEAEADANNDPNLDVDEMAHAVVEMYRSDSTVSSSTDHTFMRIVQIMMDDDTVRLRVAEDGSCTGVGIPDVWKTPDVEMAAALAGYRASCLPPGGISPALSGRPLYYRWKFPSSAPRFVLEPLSEQDRQFIEAGQGVADRFADKIRECMSPKEIPILRLNRETGFLQVAVPFIERLLRSRDASSVDDVVAIIKENCVRKTIPIRLVTPRPESRLKGMPQMPESFLVGPRDNVVVMKLPDGSHAAYESGLNTNALIFDEEPAAGAAAGAGRMVDDDDDGGPPDPLTATRLDRIHGLTDTYQETDSTNMVRLCGMDETRLLSSIIDTPDTRVDNIDELAWCVHCMRLGLDPETDAAKQVSNEYILDKIRRSKERLYETGRWKESGNKVYPRDVAKALNRQVEGGRRSESAMDAIRRRVSRTSTPRATPTPSTSSRVVSKATSFSISRIARKEAERCTTQWKASDGADLLEVYASAVGMPSRKRARQEGGSTGQTGAPASECTDTDVFADLDTDREVPADGQPKRSREATDDRLDEDTELLRALEGLDA